MSTYRFMKRLYIILSVVIWISLSIGLVPALCNAETVYVKYRGPVNLSQFKCDWISRSSLVKRLCYDKKEAYVIVNLNGTYYHYCEVPSSVIAAWRNAESMGRFYNANMKGRYDCRVLRIPPYK